MRHVRSCRAVGPATSVKATREGNCSTEPLFNVESRKWRFPAGVCAIFVPAFAYICLLGTCLRFKTSGGEMCLVPSHKHGSVTRQLSDGGKFVREVRPVEGVNYFVHTRTHDAAQVPVATMLGVYNEDGRELRRTLESLLDHRQEILIIVDGVQKLSNTMKEYLSSLWENDLPFNAEDWQAGEETFILSGAPQGTNLCTLHLALKRHNRKKYNSHEWFLRSFAPEIGAHYAFIGDCGAYFHSTCLGNMVLHMEENSGLVASTARQFIMSSDRQHGQPDSWLQWATRCFNIVDNEYSMLISQSIGSNAGFLSVLPGPCAMFRIADIQGQCLQKYFELMYSSPEDIGLFGSLIVLVEDRPLTLFSATYSGKRQELVWNATYEFDHEPTLERFVQQRRRWQNGIVAYFLYMTRQLPQIANAANHSSLFKLQNLVVTLVTLWDVIITFACPGLRAVGFVFGLNFLSQFLNVNSDMLTVTALSLWLVLWSAFVFLHCKRTRCDIALNRVAFIVTSVYTSSLWILFLVMAVYEIVAKDCAMIINLINIMWRILNRISIHHVYLHVWLRIRYSQTVCLKAFLLLLVHLLHTFLAKRIAKDRVILCLPFLQYALIACAPILQADCHGLKTISAHLLTFVFANPIYTSVVHAYSFTRMADLSWGNRPAEMKSNSRLDVTKKCSFVAHDGQSCKQCCVGDSSLCAHHRFLTKVQMRASCFIAVYVGSNVSIPLLFIDIQPETGIVLIVLCLIPLILQVAILLLSSLLGIMMKPCQSRKVIQPKTLEAV